MSTSRMRDTIRRYALPVCVLDAEGKACHDSSSTSSAGYEHVVWGSEDTLCNLESEDTLSNGINSDQGSCIEEAPAVQQKPAEDTEANNITTVMMYDIPFEVTRDQVTNLLIEYGFTDTYDFFYLPASNGGVGNEGENPEARSINVGYAFIKFKTAQHATQCLDVFQDFAFPNYDSKKLTCTKLANCEAYDGAMQKRTNKGRRGRSRLWRKCLL